MALSHKGFPFSLTGQFRQSGHIFFPVEIVDRVANHEDMGALAIELHVEDADGALAFNNLRPNVGVNVAIFFDKLRVVDEFEGLAVSFHKFGVVQFGVVQLSGIEIAR